MPQSTDSFAAKRPPIAQNDYYIVPADTALSGNVLANDYSPSGSELSAAEYGRPYYPHGGLYPYHGEASIADDGSFLYTPDSGYVGQDQFRYVVIDEAGKTSFGTVNVLVVSYNPPPVAQMDNFVTTEDTVLTGNLLANDYDTGGMPLRVVPSTQTSSSYTMAIAEDGSFVFTPAPGFTGSSSFFYTVTDGQETDSDSVFIRVVAGNPNPYDKLAPVTQKDYYYVAVDGSLSGNVLSNDYDPDGSSLSAVVLAAPEHGKLALAADGSFVYIPQAEYNGRDQFAFIVSDESGKNKLSQADIRVGIPDAYPSPSRDTYYTDAGSELTGNVLANDYDPEGPDLTASLETAPLHGELTLNSDGSFSYVPDIGFAGGDYFYYTATDPAGNAPTEIVNILVGVPVLADGQA
jgi:hypothetical protein